MRILRVILLLLMLAGAVVLFFHSKKAAPPATSPYEMAQYAGERLAYDLYYGNLKVGESVLTFHGEKRVEGKRVYHITFATSAPFFSDVEEIYADTKTMLPLKVRRLIKRIGSFTTEIEETYDQDAFRVTVEKKGVFSRKEFTIEKDAPIHNAVLLPYYYRMAPAAKEGQAFKVNLPTAHFEVASKGKGEVVTPLGKYTAHIFASTPSKFTVWLSDDKKRIPVKIEDHAALGYSLIINSVNEPDPLRNE